MLLVITGGRVILEGEKTSVRHSHLPKSDMGVLRVPVLVREGRNCRCSINCLPTVCTKNSKIFSPLKESHNGDTVRNQVSI